MPFSEQPVDGGDLHGQHTAYVQANEELRAAVVAVAGSLDVIGYDVAADDERVDEIARAVLTRLEELRPHATMIAASRPYVIALPGGQFCTDEALADLDAAAARAHAAIAARQSAIAGRLRARRRADARDTAGQAEQRIAMLTAEATRLQHQYADTESTSREGLEVRIRAYELMCELADVRDVRNSALVEAGELSSAAERSRRESNNEQRRLAGDALPILARQLNDLDRH